MTFIKRLELQGFKSFANKMTVDLSEGFSTFVGANGSGKSNVIDALCFVLGKSSKKSMRAELLSDLIFNGGKKGRSAKYAEVGLVFDNSNNVFPYEGDEFKISRRVLEKGNSVFKINDNTVKLQEITNALQSANIDPDGFNIILQGEIQKFVDLKDDERRKVIEDVSGISVYESKKKKSIRELEKVEDKLKEARTRLAERERYLKEIINDKKQAEKYLKMQEELKDKKASLLFKKIHDLEQERTVYDEKINKHKESLKQAEAEIRGHEQDIESLQEELVGLKTELAKRGDEEQQAIAKKIDLVKEKKLELENIISNHTREIKRIKQREQNVKKELKDVKLSIKKARQELEEFSTKIKSLAGELKEKREASEVAMADRLVEAKEELLSIEEELSSLKEKLMLIEQSKEYSAEIKKLREKLDIKKSRLEEVVKSLSVNNDKLRELDKKKEEVMDYLQHLNSVRIKLETKKESLIDYSTKGVKSIMNSGINGVEGTIASLGLVDKRFNTALNVAAGSMINSVVVSDDKCAQRCIEYLRRSKSGTASFIPLNKIKSRPVSSSDKKLKKVKGAVDFAINLVNFDDKYRQAFEYVFRNTLVVHDLDTARRVGLNTIRMVTLEGDLINTSGLMTGGYRGKSSSGFLDKDIDKQFIELETNERKYNRYKKEINEELSRLRELIIKDREEKARIESLINELGENIESLEPRVKEVSGPQEIEGRIKSLTERKAELKELLKQKVNEQVINRVKEEINHLEDEYNQLVIDKGVKESELNKVLVKEQERLVEIMDKMAEESKVFKQELAQAKEDLENKTGELKELKKEESKFYKELKDLYDERDKVLKAVEDNEKAISELRKSNYDVKEKVQSLNLERASIVAKLDGLRTAFKEFSDWEPRQVRKSVEDLQVDINKLEVVIKNFGPVNMKSIETYREAEKDFDRIKNKTDELTSEKEEVLNVIEGIEDKKKKTFLDAFNEIRDNFKRIFARLSPGGIAKLILENEEDPFEGGVIALIRPKGKKILTLKSMSGGEKTIAALAFIFAIQEYNPTPFYIMDEVDAALDKANTDKLAEMIADYSNRSQFIVVSHNDELISASNYLYGVSMDKKGVSDIVSIKLPE
ncbi:chromosome segregation protein SMC [archaeon]|nr:chromosome segregation protein SMC [archaeon]